jgi:predicted DNA-binding transcriptional regulator AlpA
VSTAESEWPELIDKQEVLQRIGVCERTLENWLNSTSKKFPPPVRVGKKNMWDVRAIKRYLQLTFEAQLSWTPGRKPRKNVAAASSAGLALDKR